MDSSSFENNQNNQNNQNITQKKKERWFSKTKLGMGLVCI